MHLFIALWLLNNYYLIVDCLNNVRNRDTCSSEWIDKLDMSSAAILLTWPSFVFRVSQTAESGLGVNLPQIFINLISKFKHEKKVKQKVLLLLSCQIKLSNRISPYLLLSQLLISTVWWIGSDLSLPARQFVSLSSKALVLRWKGKIWFWNENLELVEIEFVFVF